MSTFRARASKRIECNLTADIVKKRYSVTLREPYIACLNQLVDRGIFSDEQEAIRDSLRDTFEKYDFEPFKTVPKEEKAP